jgi:hypothetical protein
MFIRSKTNNWTVDLAYFKLRDNRVRHFNAMTYNIWRKILNTRHSIEARINRLKIELADQTVGSECIDGLAQITSIRWGVHDHQSEN